MPALMEASPWNRPHSSLTDFPVVPSRMAKHDETQHDVAPIGIGPTSPSQDFPVVPPRMAKRDELVWLYNKVSLD
jgi:hypothetical protein